MTLFIKENSYMVEIRVHWLKISQNYVFIEWDLSSILINIEMQIIIHFLYYKLS